MIQLTKDLWMDADERCYIVGKPRQSADKVVRLDKPTYYSTAARAAYGALKRAMRQGVADGSITTLREFVKEQERLRDEMDKLLAPLGNGKSWETLVEARQTAPTGNHTPQNQDGEKEA